MLDKIANDKILYNLAVLRYKEINSKFDDKELFPSDFYLSKDYHLKVEIIAEAIQKNILVEDTNGYKNNFEKLKTNRKNNNVDQY